VRVAVLMIPSLSCFVPVLPLVSWFSCAPVFRDHPRMLKVWVGGHGFDVADGENGSSEQSRTWSGSAGTATVVRDGRAEPRRCGERCYLACAAVSTLVHCL
jgi:hypothetical protein